MAKNKFSAKASSVTVVRKSQADRTLVAVFGILFFLGITILVATFGHFYATWILYLPIVFIVCPMALYYFSWRIEFGEKDIVKYLFFREVKRYSYTRVQEVIKRFSMVENGTCIIIIFKDGKMLSFRMRDHGYAKAFNKLQHHHSIIVKESHF
ncbi:MAG: hypothetical protein IKT58_05805 [Oscillospiraceae bacterium]|nr:hypothetical protein [Oscillospiraceae bacterium]